MRLEPASSGMLQPRNLPIPCDFIELEGVGSHLPLEWYMEKMVEKDAYNDLSPTLMGHDRCCSEIP